MTRDARKRRAQGEVVENITGKGIDSITQVDSVLREMSELQYKIDTENNLLNDRINMLKEYTREITESDLCHQHNLNQMLKAFIKRICKNGTAIKRHYRFGSISFSKKKLDIELKPALAGELINKP